LFRGVWQKSLAHQSIWAKHYKRAVPKLEAKKFWALRPQRPGKIIPMLATA
jgi:hypothetical protein